MNLNLLRDQLHCPLTVQTNQECVERSTTVVANVISSITVTSPSMISTDFKRTSCKLVMFCASRLIALFCRDIGRLLSNLSRWSASSNSKFSASYHIGHTEQFIGQSRSANS